MRLPADSHAPPIVQAFDTAFRYLRWLALLLAVLYLATGITTVQPDQEAIVLTLGKVTRPPKPAGLLLTWPYPIDEVVRVSTREAKVLDTTDALWHSLDLPSGVSQDPLSPQYVFAQEFVPEKIDPEREGYCIAGDKDILQARVAVKYRVGSAVDYALRQADPEALLRAVTLAAVTRSIGEMSGGDALARRGLLTSRIHSRIQKRLDDVQSGITVDSVELVQLHPPRHVLRDFQQVYLAKIEAANMVQESKDDAVRRIGLAEAQALTIVNEAENHAQTVRKEAEGQGQVFRDLVAEYHKAPEVVAGRLYREAVKDITSRVRLRAVGAGEGPVYVDFPEPPPKAPERPK